MTSNVKLLPLPKWMERFVIPGDAHGDQTLSDRMTDYALANVLHHTAPLRYALDNAARDIKSLRGVRDAHAAEIEALRERADKFKWQVRDTCVRAEKAESQLAELRAEREVICAEAVKYAGMSGRLEAKVDRLAEALRKITELRERHHDNLNDAIYIAGEALRDNEQGVGNGGPDLGALQGKGRRHGALV